ncbi:hypothetical protein ACCS54_35810 [Rhizobium johnstonii]|uniref:spike base protein, RCAP_Rcc01079 family n=1 Tax=Rhizobium johnstonii TaxID=3019933 RepID=UPI003F98EB22
MALRLLPASRAAAVTPNDTAIVGARALYISTAGDVAIAPCRDMDPLAHTRSERGLKRALWAALEHDAILAFCQKMT